MSELLKTITEIDSPSLGDGLFELSYQNYVKTILMYSGYLRDLGIPPKGDENFVGGMPVTLDINCITQLLKKVNDQYDYHITLKVDGERVLCCVLNNDLVFLDRNLQPYYIVDKDRTIVKANTSPCILDCEIYPVPNIGITIIFVFDCIADNKAKIFKLDYFKRYQFIGKRCTELNNLLALQKINDFVFIPKPWNNINILENEEIRTNPEKWMSKQLTDQLSKNLRMNKITINSDGLILQPFSTPYVTYGPWQMKGNTLFKYKTSGKQTVDLKVGLKLGESFTKINGDWVVRLMTKWDRFLTLPKELTGSNLAVQAYLRLPGKWEEVTSADGVQGLIKTSSTKGLTKVMVGDVLELVVNPPPQDVLTDEQSTNMKFMEKRMINTFTFDRIRPQKEPNALGSIMSIFNFITNPFNLGEKLWTLMSHKTNNKGNLSSYLNNFPPEALINCAIKN